MFTLEQLEQLLAVERDQTLSRAARSLAVSQPTLTRSMQALERAGRPVVFAHEKPNRPQRSRKKDGRVRAGCAQTMRTVSK